MGLVVLQFMNTHSCVANLFAFSEVAMFKSLSPQKNKSKKHINSAVFPSHTKSSWIFISSNDIDMYLFCSENVLVFTDKPFRTLVLKLWVCLM